MFSVTSLLQYVALAALASVQSVAAFGGKTAALIADEVILSSAAVAADNQSSGPPYTVCDATCQRQVRCV